LAAGGAALWTYFNMKSVQQVQQIAQQQPAGGKQDVQPEKEKGQSQGEPQKKPPKPPKPLDSVTTHGDEQAAGDPAPPSDPKPAESSGEGGMPMPDSGKNSDGGQGNTNDPSAADNIVAAGGANSSTDSRGTPNTNHASAADENQLEGFPSHAEKKQDAWSILLPDNTARDFEIDLIGGRNLDSQYDLWIVSTERTGDLKAAWNIRFSAKKASTKGTAASEATLRPIHLTANELRIESRTNSAANETLAKCVLRFTHGDHTHYMHLHSPLHVNYSFTSEDLLDQLEWKSITLSDWQISDKIVRWHLKTPKQANTDLKEAETVTISPIEGQPCTLTVKLGISKNRKNIKPRCRFDIAIPSALAGILTPPTTLDGEPVGDLPVKQQQQLWIKEITNAQQKLTKTPPPESKEEQKKLKEQEEALNQFQKNFENLSTTIKEAMKNIRIDYDVYAIVDDPRKKQKLEMLMYTTDPEWEKRPVVRVASEQPSE